MERKYTIAIALVPIMVFVDQITKWLVVKNIKLHTKVQVIEGFLDWNYLQNRGVAFGMLRNLPENLGVPLLAGLNVIAIGFVIYFLVVSEDEKYLFHICIVSVISGALGNMIDRLHYGYVVDFILVKADFLGTGIVSKLDKWPGTHEWPNFNVADTLVVVGIIGITIDMLFFTEFEEGGEDGG